MAIDFTEISFIGHFLCLLDRGGKSRKWSFLVPRPILGEGGMLPVLPHSSSARLTNPWGVGLLAVLLHSSSARLTNPWGDGTVGNSATQQFCQIDQPLVVEE